MCGKFQGPLAMVRIWTDFLWPIGPSIQTRWLENSWKVANVEIFLVRITKKNLMGVIFRVLSMRVGEIVLCLISINSPSRFTRRGINISFFTKKYYSQVLAYFSKVIQKYSISKCIILLVKDLQNAADRDCKWFTCI